MRADRLFSLVFTGFYAVIAQSQPLYTDNLFHPDTLRSVVEILASDSMQGRYSGSDGCSKAALYIAGEFKKAGLRPVAGNNGYLMPVHSRWGNVVGVIPGRSKPGELIIFSAHYDHIGTLSTNPFPFIKKNEGYGKKDTIYNGANDDASGVCAVISLARYFAGTNRNERTLVFVLFAGEELGLLGSGYFADNCEPDSIKAVINIEMIGRKFFSGGRPYITGNDNSDLRNMLNRRLYQVDPEKYNKSFIQKDPFSDEGLFMRSDNYSFAKYGIPAHSIMVTSPKDMYYHSLKDEVKTLDYKLMSRVILAIIIGCDGLIDGSESPSRIKSKK